MTRREILAGGTASTLAFVTAPPVVLGHHGITDYYDSSASIILYGEILRVVFALPHPEVSLRLEAFEAPLSKVDRPDEFVGPFIERAEDLGQVREVEFSPVGAFYGLADRMTESDRVLILASQNCQTPRQLRSSWIRLAKGDIVLYEHGWDRRSGGCE